MIIRLSPAQAIVIGGLVKSSICPSIARGSIIHLYYVSKNCTYRLRIDSPQQYYMSLEISHAFS